MLHKRFFAAITGIALLAACTKDKILPEDIYAKNGITAVVNSNFSLSLFKYALVATTYNDTLSTPGPYTLLGPSNNAFTAAGFTSGTAIIRALDSMRAIVPYHIIRGRVRLDSLPLAFNQLFTTMSGQPLYITHWINSRDTAVVVNGVRISIYDKPASNGLVNVTDGILNPVVYSHIQQAISGDPQLSLFNAAVIQSGLAAEYQAGGPYTVFAPVNSAFAAIGINTTDSIYHMDPSALKSMVQAHIAAGRNFTYDYILKADVRSNRFIEHMLNGANATITLAPDNTQPGRFSGIYIQNASLSRKNILAANGVVHSISRVLTQ
ncbi:fasciclin domain-containing protein [Chitinophaga vietnamensis]|uniref:fasciclin domain-containing protein n=1 Tax=Chitinophaga vietnamensis TaxID=2593957 RepID=UPI0013764319|nr:fasciclin domain-containing protein [Chitinophaga vietnamensis]